MELVSPSATTTATPPQDVDPDAPGHAGARAERRAHGPPRPRSAARPSSSGRCSEGRPFETHLAGPWFFGMPGGPFGSFGSEQLAADHRVPRSRLRRAHPPQPGVVRLPPPPERPPRVPGQARRARRGDLGRAAAPGPAALQPGRLHLLRAGRDDEPPHQPVLVRARGARDDPVQPDGRHGVVGHRIALRSDLPERRRPARPGLGAPDPARPRPAPPAGGGRHSPWSWPPRPHWPGRSNTIRPTPS